jgi:hypothetical protein
MAMRIAFYLVIVIARKKCRKAKRDVPRNYAPRVIVVPSCHSRVIPLAILRPASITAKFSRIRTRRLSKREQKETTIVVDENELASRITLDLEFPLESSSSIIGQDTIFRRACTTS